MALLLGFFSTTSIGYKVMLDGEVLGYTKDATVFTQSLNQVEQGIKSKTSIDTAYVYNDIQIKKSITINKPMFSEEAFTEALNASDLQVGVEGVELKIDGQTVANLASEDHVDIGIATAINKIGNVQGDDKLVKCDVQSNVEKTPKKFPVEELKTSEEAANILATGELNPSESNQNTNSTASIEVASRGADVARDQSAEQTQEAAPTAEGTVENNTENVTAQNNQGTETSSSILKINLTKTSTKKEAIPFQIVEQQDPNVYADQTTISQQGKNGELHREVEVIYENGKIINETVLSETVAVEPVTQVVSKGAKNYPTLASKKDSFILPANGNISALDKPGSHAGCFAVDIAAPTGTPIYAPQSGTVIRASDFGGYGLCLDIQMDNGTVLRMGHNSAFRVKVGDRVQKGQLVADMGNTGNSTGPHSHFEIRVNDTQVYLPDYFDIKDGDNI